MATLRLKPRPAPVAVKAAAPSPKAPPKQSSQPEAIKAPPAQPTPKQIAARQARTAAALRWLRTLPAFARVQPLMIGIRRVLRPPPEISQNDLSRALHAYTSSERYLRALAEPDAVRVDPHGQPVAPVSDADRANAAETLAALEDLR